jgi:hypothetical protein
MVTVKRLLCLANSRKFVGRCVAGKESATGPGGWIRPVSSRPGHEVSRDERTYNDGTEPQVLDLIDVPLTDPVPTGFQSENWTLDPSRRWARQGTVSINELAEWVDAPPTLWVNGHSTYHGLNDQVPADSVNDLSTSLYLVRVESVVLRVFAPGANFGDDRRRVQGQFAYRGVQYWLRVTDAQIEDEFLKKANGTYQIGAAYLTISLAEEAYKGHHYKLIAAVIRAS